MAIYIVFNAQIPNRAKWDAINFEHKTFTVRRKVVCVFTEGKKEIRVENKLKTKPSVRTFPLITHIERDILYIDQRSIIIHSEVFKNA